MYLTYSKSITTAILIALISVIISYGGDNISLLKPGAKGGWFVFGYGVMDSASEPGNSGFLIDLDWNKSVWGVGAMFNMDRPIKGKKLKAVRAKIKTLSGSKTEVFAAVATKDDANLVYNKNKAFEISDKWQVFTFPVSGMIKSKPDITSRLFSDSDWSKIQVVKILFTKATSGAMKDKILVQDPELIFD